MVEVPAVCRQSTTPQPQVDGSEPFFPDSQFLWHFFVSVTSLQFVRGSVCPFLHTSVTFHSWPRAWSTQIVAGNEYPRGTAMF